MEAEVRALRAQISPHFIYNSLDRDRVVRAHRPRAGARAAAGVRRLHALLVPRHGEFTTLAEELGRSSATSCWSRPASATGSR
jgi:two-component system LytT family sensor kinase